MKYKNDPYQIEYAAIEDVEILREGTWNWREYDREFMEEMALLYDIKMLRAKVIKDHEYYGPAFGHVLALHVEDDPSADGTFRLMGTTGFLEEGKAMIESGQYNERSQGWASFYPTPGFPYLWEFSLLGANTPAVTGMEPIIFTEEDQDKMMQQLAIDHTNEGLTAEAIANKLTWEKDEEYILHKVRNKSRFRTSLRTVEIDVEAGVLAKVGKLKVKYVGEDGDSDSLVMQSVMFVLGKGWTLKKAMAWVEARQLAEMSFTIKSTVPFQDLPIADAETEWDREASETRRREFALEEDEINWDIYRLLHLWSLPDEKEKHESYKLPIVDVVDGELKIIPKAVIAAAESLADIPEVDAEAVKQSLEKYYAKMELKAPWQEEKKEDSPTGAETIKDLTTLSLEGGIEMPETKVGETGVDKSSIVVVEPGSTVDLAAANAKIRAAKEEQERLTQAKLERENTELGGQLELARLEAIKSDLRTMQAEGYITGTQIEMGLEDALAAIPNIDIVVGDKTCSGVDIIKDALKYGGKLKLKLEIAKDILNDDSGDPLVKARALGINTSVEERRIQLMKDNPEMSHADALDQATREVQK